MCLPVCVCICVFDAAVASPALRLRLRLPGSDSTSCLLGKHSSGDKSVQIFESLNCILFYYYLFSLFSLFS